MSEFDKLVKMKKVLLMSSLTIVHVMSGIWLYDRHTGPLRNGCIDEDKLGPDATVGDLYRIVRRQLRVKQGEIGLFDGYDFTSPIDQRQSSVCLSDLERPIQTRGDEETKIYVEIIETFEC